MIETKKDKDAEGNPEDGEGKEASVEINRLGTAMGDDKPRPIGSKAAKLILKKSKLDVAGAAVASDGNSRANMASAATLLGESTGDFSQTLKMKARQDNIHGMIRSYMALGHNDAATALLNQLAADQKREDDRAAEEAKKPAAVESVAAPADPAAAPTSNHAAASTSDPAGPHRCVDKRPC